MSFLSGAWEHFRRRAGRRQCELCGIDVFWVKVPGHAERIRMSECYTLGASKLSLIEHTPGLCLKTRTVGESE